MPLCYSQAVQGVTRACRAAGPLLPQPSLASFHRYCFQTCFLTTAHIFLWDWVMSHWNSLVEALTSPPSTSECHCIWTSGLYRGNKIKMKSLGWSLIQCDWRFYRKRERERHQWYLWTEERACENTGNVVTCQPRKWPQKDWPSQLQNGEKRNFCCFQHPVYGICFGSHSKLIHIANFTLVLISHKS